ncbi:MAG: hypothetical protein R2744_02455 [Bacteroidales bacterium]
MKSDFKLLYKNIDSEISPSEIELETVMTNRIGRMVVQSARINLGLNSKGIYKLHVDDKRNKLKAECTG